MCDYAGQSLSPGAVYLQTRETNKDNGRIARVESHQHLEAINLSGEPEELQKIALGIVN